MTRKAGNRANAKAPKASNGNQVQAQGGASSSKTTPQLELPEGYRPQKGPKKNKTKGKKPGNTEAGNVAGANGTAQATSPSDLRRRYDELGVDLNPGSSRPLLKFDSSRRWVSIEKPVEYLERYSKFQASKYEPPVFAAEPSDDPETRELRRRRRLYFESKGRLDRLAVLEKVKGWPFKFGVPTRAPFIPCSEHAVVEKADNRDLPLFKVLGHTELADRILGYCAPHFQDVANLGLTCWAVFNTIRASIEHWNMTERDFLSYNIDTEEPIGAPRPTSRIVIVSQVRPEMTRSDSVRGDSNYSTEFNGIIDLFKALNNRSAGIMNLQLHRIPFLNIQAVDCIVSSLPNLENLGIYQCPLLHFATTGKLLGIIEANKKEAGFVHLDFFPTFHQGPDVSNRQGSFGVTWSDPGINTLAGILKLLIYEYYPKARGLGFDLFNDANAFRRWLEKCPLPDWTVVRANEAVKTYEAKRRLKGFGEQWMADSADPAFKRLADELAAAMHIEDDTEPVAVPGQDVSDARARRDQDRTGGWWRGESDHCDKCGRGANILLPFFPFYQHDLCYGCRLGDALDEQDDHLKLWQAGAMKRWLNNPQHECKTLAAAVESPSRWDGAHFASRADAAYEFDRTHNHRIGVEDLIWRVDSTSLDRRYRREREPHGAIDRRREERQYVPAGKENVHVSIDLAGPALFVAHFFSDQKEEAFKQHLRQRYEEEKKKKEEEEALKQQLRQADKEADEEEEASEQQLRQRDREKKKKEDEEQQQLLEEVFKLQKFNASRRLRTRPQAEMEALVASHRVRDEQQLVSRHRVWRALAATPNRPAQEWDGMREGALDDAERRLNGGRLRRPRREVDPQWAR